MSFNADTRRQAGLAPSVASVGQPWSGDRGHSRTRNWSL